MPPLDHDLSSHADPLAEARGRLSAAAASELPVLPWQHPSAPPDDSVLARHALWRASEQPGGGAADGLVDGLRILRGARCELDAIETALIFTARAEGLTWGQIADALDLRSPQAAQQRFRRVADRPGSEADGGGAR